MAEQTVTITIFGTTPPCVKCKRAEQEAHKAASRFPGKVEVRKLDALGPEAEKFGMFVTPAVAVNGKLIASGKIVPADQLATHIQKILGG